MAFKKITKEGERFIRTILNGPSTSHIIGKNRYNLPYGESSNTSKTFTATPLFRNGVTPIVSDALLAEALIDYYNYYSRLYNIDANVMAAQAFQESGYFVWNYAKTSSAIGISQFTSITIYETVVTNGGPNGGNLLKFTQDEINRLINGLENPFADTSYRYGGSSTTPATRLIAKKNRDILHQNWIDNLDIAIKAQCRLMAGILSRNNNYVSSALFAYNRGSFLSSKNYGQLINKTIKSRGRDYIKEGVDYVEKIFRYLGDRNNNLVSRPINRSTNGIWFGYDIDFSYDPQKPNLA